MVNLLTQPSTYAAAPATGGTRELEEGAPLQMLLFWVISL